MFGSSISSRVAKVIKQRVMDAQKEHDAKKVELEKEMTSKLESHANEMVGKIIGK